MSTSKPVYLSEPTVLNTEETAQYINRSENFVRRTLRYEVPVIQRGDRGPMYFRRGDLDVWLAMNTIQPVLAPAGRSARR